VGFLGPPATAPGPGLTRARAPAPEAAFSPGCG
jgi:hypothetical protein